MKKVFILIILIIGITACENQPMEYVDFDYTAVYFPIQLPLRTLSLGEDRIDNSLDKEFKLHVGVSIGGLYSNKKDWTVDYEVDNSLAADVYTSKTPNLKIIPLPSSYYTLSPENTTIIHSGSFNGLILVQLTDAFFNDTLSITGQYVLPLKITATSADSILSGKASAENPDPRIVGHWLSNKSPKNWVMYGIKYVNAYHGTYLHRGRDIRITTATGVPKDTIKFRDPNGYIEKSPLIELFTTGRNRVITNGVGNLLANNSMTLTLANDKGTPGNIVITPTDGAAFPVSGTGQYYDIATSVEQWTLRTWQSMYLNYTYNDGTYTHQILDTLVFRDRGIKYEENTIQIIP